MMTNLRAPDTLARPGEWRLRAVCADPSVDPAVMFPENANERGARAARVICRGCPVALDCLIDVMGTEGRTEYGRHGVYAGTSSSQRQGLYEQIDRGEVTLRAGAVELLARVLAQPRTMRDAFEGRVLPEDDGHVKWNRQQTQVTFEGRSYTPKQMAFVLGYGRPHEGRIKAECGRIGCVAWQHLSDDLMRHHAKYGTAA